MPRRRLEKNVKALAFDVFGTVVDWRGSIIREAAAFGAEHAIDADWAGDLSTNGLRQSFGMMVNYLYELDRVEEYHERFLDGDVVHAPAVARLV